MEIESDIRVTEEDVYPEQFARPYNGLGAEVRQGIQFLRPRFGNAPRIASVKLNDACNLSCDHCYANRIKGRPMTAEQVLQVVDNLAAVNNQYLNFTGGEPTLRKELPQFIERSRRLGMVTTLNTNGGVRKERLTEEYAYWYGLAEKGLSGAYFSYDKTGQKSDPRVIHLAAFLVNTLHIFGGINTVVTQDNLDKVFEIGRECMQNNIFFLAVPAVALGGESSALPEDFRLLDGQGRREFINITHRLSRIRGPFARFLRMQDAYLSEVVATVDPNSAWHCKNPSAHWIFVDAQGRARVCNERVLPGGWSLTGKENPLLNKKFHEVVKNESEKCGGCSWYCNWEANRKQSVRALSEIRLFMTMGSLT